MLKMGLHAGFIGASVTGLSSKEFCQNKIIMGPQVVQNL